MFFTMFFFTFKLGCFIYEDNLLANDQTSFEWRNNTEIATLVKADP